MNGKFKFYGSGLRACRPDILAAVRPQRVSSFQSAETYTTPQLDRMVRELAQFRYALRKFLRFSELAARGCGVTPQQHQLMLGVQGYTGRGSATISELAEFLQERHHSVVGLVERAVQRGLLARMHDAIDRRVVNVSLTPKGYKTLMELTRMHYGEAKRLKNLWQTCAPPVGSAAKTKAIARTRIWL
jgi:DNA-binding MarR family transcriptional regulator